MKIKETKYVVVIPEVIDFDAKHGGIPSWAPAGTTEWYGKGYYGLKSPYIGSFQFNRADIKHESFLDTFTLFNSVKAANNAITKARHEAENDLKHHGDTWAINSINIHDYLELIKKLQVIEVEVTHEVKGL